MPVELRIDTDGKTETKRIEVSGMDSAYCGGDFRQAAQDYHGSRTIGC